MHSYNGQNLDLIILNTMNNTYMWTTVAHTSQQAQAIIVLVQAFPTTQLERGNWRKRTTTWRLNSQPTPYCGVSATQTISVAEILQLQSSHNTYWQLLYYYAKVTINVLLLCILIIISVSNGTAERLNTAEIVADSAAFFWPAMKLPSHLQLTC